MDVEIDVYATLKLCMLLETSFPVMLHYLQFLRFPACFYL